MLKFSSLWTRESNSSWSILSDCASVPTLGSRFVGLLSMIMTSVLGSGRLAQPIRAMRMTDIKNNHRERRGAPRVFFWNSEPASFAGEGALSSAKCRQEYLVLFVTIGISRGGRDLKKKAPLIPRLMCLYIGNFSQHHSFLRTRGRGHISGLAMPRLVCQQCKGNGFFGLAGDTVIVRVAELQPQLGGFFHQHVH